MIMNSQNLVIAVDGPAASGKGVLGRKLAERLDLEYLDTGKLYRLAALKIKEKNLDATKPENKDELLKILKKIKVSEELNSESLNKYEVGAVASVIAKIPEVRDYLLLLQRDFIKDNLFRVVLDGRDIGTVVYPEADLKFYLVADIKIRSERRYNQLLEKGYSVTYQNILEDLKIRDARDSSRTLAPLEIADDAILIDSSNIIEEEVLDKALSFVYEKVSI